MGCLYAKTSRIGGLEVTIGVSVPLRVSAARIDPFRLFSERMEELVPAAARQTPLKVRASIVCTASDAYYLYVTPTEVQWITEDNPAVFHVHSNTDWEIR